MSDIIADIKSLKIQGAREIAVKSLKFLRGFTAKNGFGRDFELVAKRLEEARPTAVVLHNCLEALRKERKAKTIDMLLKRLEDSRELIAKNGLKLIKNNSTIMTHCHSGEALAVLKNAWKKGRRFSVIATETEPRHQGIKTAKELAAMKIPVTLITDSAANYFMPEVDFVIVGADAIRFRQPKGLVNKIGTSALALSARAHKKPFYSAASSFKIDNRRKIIIEERPTSEVYHAGFHGVQGVKVRNPAFDITSLDHVTKFVNEKGVYTNKQLEKATKKNAIKVF